MIKHLFLGGLFALCAGVAAGLTANTAVVSAETTQTSTAAVSFTAPKVSAVAFSHVPHLAFAPASTATQAQDVDASTGDAYVGVTDSGVANGWAVAVAASDFASADAQAHIRSAQLTFDQTDGSDTTITTGGDAATLVCAADQAATGAATFASSAVHLHIPAGNTAASYSANLQWTLSNAVQ